MHDGNHCSSCNACSASDHAPGDGAAPPLTGWRFTFTSAGVFLLPVLLAIVGAIYGGAEDNLSGQAIGGGLGLLLGMLLTSAVSLIADRSTSLRS